MGFFVVFSAVFFFIIIILSTQVKPQVSKTNLRVYKVNRNSLGYETELTEYTATKYFSFILASTTAFPGLWHQVSQLKKLRCAFYR